MPNGETKQWDIATSAQNGKIQYILRVWPGEFTQIEQAGVRMQTKNILFLKKNQQTVDAVRRGLYRFPENKTQQDHEV